MDNNSSLMTELLDIKRQNTDWEIKLEANSDFLCDTTDATDDHSNDSANNKMDISLVTNRSTQDMADNGIGDRLFLKTDFKVNQLNGNGLVVEKTVPKISPKTRRSASNHEYDGIKNVEEFVERRKINGITWYYCLWQNCSYGSNKSNHLVRHIRGHTGERPYACDWPGCGKKFTDSWKRKDHILSHNKKVVSINKMIPSANDQKNDNSLNHFVEMLNTNNNICEPIDLDIDAKPELSLEMKDFNRDDDSNQSLNMFIPEVIMNEMDSSVDNVVHTEPNTELISEPNPIPDDLNVIQQYIERTTKDGKVWYLCKFSSEFYTVVQRLYHRLRFHYNNSLHHFLLERIGKIIIVCSLVFLYLCNS